MPKDKSRPHPTPDDLRHRFEDLAARFGEKSRPAPEAPGSRPPADDYWESLQDLFTRDVTARDFKDLVSRDSEDTLRFFTREIDFSALESKPWYERYPATAWKVFLAMSFRLSPARRVLFAAAVILLAVAWLKWIVTQTTVSVWAVWGIPAALLSATLLFLVLLVEMRDKLALKGDLEIARQIQFGLLPFAPFSRAGTSVYTAMRPANTVGGDYFDIIGLPDGRIALAMGDVAGKGIPAALLMALLQGSLRTLITAGFRGAELVRTLNDHLLANIPRNRLVTLFYAELDPATGALHYVNAGHNAPFLLRSTGATRLGATGVALGVIGGSAYEERGDTLALGERLFLFTDGITEAFDPGDQEYGEPRLEGFLLGRHALRSPELIDAVRDDVLAFCGSVRPHDDMTMMVVER
jgi:sigma-B regulation protein RsbU (phosphoserine phosphatase)